LGADCPKEMIKKEDQIVLQTQIQTQNYTLTNVLGQRHGLNLSLNLSFI